MKVSDSSKQPRATTRNRKRPTSHFNTLENLSNITSPCAERLPAPSVTRAPGSAAGPTFQALWTRFQRVNVASASLRLRLAASSTLPRPSRADSRLAVLPLERAHHCHHTQAVNFGFHISWLSDA